MLGAYAWWMILARNAAVSPDVARVNRQRLAEDRRRRRALGPHLSQRWSR